jgi:two-component system NarL family sensor kinase
VVARPTPSARRPRAIDASEQERRRIARDLHDGVVQSLAGLGFGLAAAAEELPEGSPARNTVEEGAEQARRSVRELRTLLVEIYPPTLQRAGLQSALADLLSGIGDEGCDVRLRVEPPELRLPPDTEALLFRAAQESVRNVRAHAGAHQLDVTVVQTNGRVALEVVDDGRGFDPSANVDGHFGLRILADIARDADARFDVDSAPGKGTKVRLEAAAR